MGTTWSVRLVAARKTNLHALHTDIQDQLNLVVQQMSTWEETSDLSRYNRANAGQWLAIPTEFAQVLRCALEVAEASNSAFDPSIGSLVGVWGFGAHAHSTTPTPEALDIARQHAGWQRIVLDAEHNHVLQPGGVQLDLSAIAKGFAADLVATTLRHRGIESALVEVGGELLGFGQKPDGEPWRALVEAGPEEDDHHLPPRILELNDLAVATSGDRWHHYTRDGQHYTHTIDPRSGQPLAHAMAAVSVIANSAMQADAWATALSVLGAEAGFALAEQLQLGARFLTRSNGELHERMTTQFQQALAA
ncbi:MAG: FAD:protein FMN transferase [Thermomonas sp.]|uniref:FAD:protein FMN transferase n=1 Tax=Thermomonas sp. TaxID=1971895 RepID=UPI001EBF90BE|nr:FAD:protein FMN transferase [Thermomonas sp.]MBV2209080.1 FAD:protein FMN transferase [Thermomonas sp.]